MSRSRASFAAAVPFIAFALGTSFVVGCGSSAQTHASDPSSVDAVAVTASETDDGLAKLTDEQLVRKLLDVTGAGNLGVQVAHNMMETFRKMPDLPPGFIDKFKENMKVSELTDVIVPIYLKHYDRKTLIAAIHFYQTDAGQTIVKSLPLVTAESMEVGKAWGTKLAKKTLNDLGIAAPP
ncbi:MAG: DUF2059 domain-containing protein [Polyangiaceae bacterium]